MTKSKKALFSLIGAVVILGGAAGVGYYHKESTTIKVQERVQKVYTLEEVVRIEFKGEELITLESISNHWQNADYPYLEYDNTQINQWIDTLKNMETEKVVKNVEDGSAYGFNEQGMMMTFYDGVNNSQTLHIGSVNQEEQMLYIKSDQDDVIYMVPYETGAILLENPNTFVICNKILNEDASYKLSIENGESTAIEMTFDGAWYLKDYFEMPCLIKQEEMDEILDLVNALEPTAYIGTYSELSQYGLDQPKLVVTVDDTHKISFGHKKDDKVYININDDFDVYLVEQSLYQKLINLKPFDIIEKQLVHANITEIQKITLNNPQGDYTLVLNSEARDESEDPVNKVPENVELSAEEKSQEIIEANKEAVQKEEAVIDSAVIKESAMALLNEKALSQEEAYYWVDKINESLWIEAMLQNPKIEQKQERKAEATVIYELKDKSRIEIELVPYDINYYILRYNGSVQFAVNKEKVTRLFTELSHTEKDK